MKTGLKAMRVMLAGIPVVAGLCFLQGCSSTSGSTAAPAASVVPEPTQAVVKVETPAPKAIETPAVTVPVEKPKLKVVAPMTTAYSVKAGETISEIAAKYALRWQDVLAVNPSLKLNSHLRAGESVALPGHVDLSKTHAVPAAKKESPKEKKAATAKTAKGAAAKPAEAAAAPAAAAGAYVVKSGDSVSSIAAKHHVKRADLMKANNLTAESKLKVGQKLTIPGKGEAAAAEAPTSAATPAEGSAVMPPPRLPRLPPRRRCRRLLRPRLLRRPPFRLSAPFPPRLPLRRLATRRCRATRSRRARICMPSPSVGASARAS